MSRNSSASMFGGAGGRGVRASVSSLEGLRNVLRNEPEKDSAPATPIVAAPVAPSYAPSVSSLPQQDNKQSLQGLNQRLDTYLRKVRELQDDNEKLQKEIDDILAKRTAPDGRDWDKIQKPLDALDKEIKELTLDNAKVLLQIDNSKLALNDFKNKLDDETKMRKDIEKELENLKKDIEDTKQQREQLQGETKLVKDEVDRIEKCHKEEVKLLREKIRNSEVKVEMESQNSNLADIVKDMRHHYEKVAEKNLKETEDWYKSKFDTIQVKTAQNNEALESGKDELKKLLKQKKTLELQIQTSYTTIYALEDNLMKAQDENNRRLVPLNSTIINLEAELKEVRAQVEQKIESYKALLSLKMKLEKEIQQYQTLIEGMDRELEGETKA
ncbi:keratin, type I cytoskeletal 18 isoform X2 [Fundulus heteroclitus]|uniref:keratin, type I cytoskeletal 18 isoform X2 n=1 Tax=Fundulus heteroclitus TaxID=8078 RepID=UPI00165BF676|nr:keratin, type I cytoskeletal 18 isoform X2 [Fundulus heteroclitus]